MDQKRNSTEHRSIAIANPMPVNNMGEAPGALQSPTASPRAYHPEATAETTETRNTKGNHTTRSYHQELATTWPVCPGYTPSIPSP
ncbi:uncharacterized protein ACHE_10986A [Aspergillus chevalieri]|uniref:Uncharacterized protein n=1 Tax=Aspergillus chevalieri TaxID=182096 RepID=A0A7R7ZJI4_ASPCH|nr:uncharacterized protein ACHE_10986A [Aspergillus chevalieri]BCR83584.1 hypothetical protein ACHE_10986A [Aspergillus chevalieri]